ncbi:MAG: hypothetical protein QNJ41_17525 [Xenococcaceae cyanobacterium MO_188.B32]|nr:hypothetical protein [Xenococcaceae cyanobacterium MO_188.B32]
MSNIDKIVTSNLVKELDDEAAEVISGGKLVTKLIEAGGWRTVESFWNANGTAFFRSPAGAEIKVRYGGGFLGFDRQKQTLNGSDYKKLSIGLGSIGYARMQIKVPQTTYVTYDIYEGGVAVVTPPIRFYLERSLKI